MHWMGSTEGVFNLSQKVQNFMVDFTIKEVLLSICRDNTIPNTENIGTEKVRGVNNSNNSIKTMHILFPAT